MARKKKLNLMKDKEITIGHFLLESLTKDQAACMLEVIASADNLKSLMDDFMRTDPYKGTFVQTVH